MKTNGNNNKEKRIHGATIMTGEPADIT